MTYLFLFLQCMPFVHTLLDLSELYRCANPLCCSGESQEVVRGKLWLPFFQMSRRGWQTNSFLAKTTCKMNSFVTVVISIQKCWNWVVAGETGLAGRCRRKHKRFCLCDGGQLWRFSAFLRFAITEEHSPVVLVRAERAMLDSTILVFADLCKYSLYCITQEELCACNLLPCNSVCACYATLPPVGTVEKGKHTFVDNHVFCTCFLIKI